MGIAYCYDRKEETRGGHPEYGDNVVLRVVWHGRVVCGDRTIARFREELDLDDRLADVVIEFLDGETWRPIAAWDESWFGIRGGELATYWVKTLMQDRVWPCLQT